MASNAQIAANRSNAQRSTGPRTPDGKSKSRRNALKHGLTAHRLLLRTESVADFDAFYTDIVASLAPEGAFEEELVFRIAFNMWRLRRAGHVEAAIFAHQQLSIQATNATQTMNDLEERLPSKYYYVHETRILDDEAFAAAKADLVETQEQRSAPDVMLGQAFTEDGAGAVPSANSAVTKPPSNGRPSACSTNSASNTPHAGARATIEVDPAPAVPEI